MTPVIPRTNPAGVTRWISPLNLYTAYQVVPVMTANRSPHQERLVAFFPFPKVPSLQQATRATERETQHRQCLDYCSVNAGVLLVTMRMLIPPPRTGRMA